MRRKEGLPVTAARTVANASAIAGVAALHCLYFHVGEQLLDFGHDFRGNDGLLCLSASASVASDIGCAVCFVLQRCSSLFEQLHNLVDAFEVEIGDAGTKPQGDP